MVVRVAASVPIGIDRWVSFSDADRFEPAIIPVTAGKKRPTIALKHSINNKIRKILKSCNPPQLKL